MLDYHEIKRSGTESLGGGTGGKKEKLCLGYPFRLQVSFLQGLREPHCVSEAVLNTRGRKKKIPGRYAGCLNSTMLNTKVDIYFITSLISR